MTREGVASILLDRTGKQGASCSGACFWGTHPDCGLHRCECRCHYVTPGQLRALIREDRLPKWRQP